MTIADLLDFYAREHLPLKAPLTQYQHRLMQTRILDEFGTLRLDALTPELLRAWRDRLLAVHAPGTVRRYLNLLRAPLTVAVRDYCWLAETPFRYVRLPAAAPGRVRYLSEKECLCLLRCCEESHQPALYPLVVLALHTGARKTELRLLRWGDVDFVRGVVRLEHTKNGEKRAVPLVGLGLQVLDAWQMTQRPGVPWVFPRADGQQPVDFWYAWLKARDMAGLGDFHFHDLRHTAASYLAMSGATLLEIAHILGHKHLEQTRRYAHLGQSYVRDVVERMAAQFLRGSQGERS
jgi:integrase